MRKLEVVEKELSKCYLSQFSFAIIGTIIGTIFGIRSKSLKPLVVGITGGSIGDYIYGKFYACKLIQEEYDECLQYHSIGKKDHQE